MDGCGRRRCREYWSEPTAPLVEADLAPAWRSLLADPAPLLGLTAPLAAVGVTALASRTDAATEAVIVPQVRAAATEIADRLAVVAG